MAVTQKILFGSPGTGKSFSIAGVDNENSYVQRLGIDKESKNCIKTVFHPEYSYGDFMGKLLPLTDNGKVSYNFYEGHFLKAIAQALKSRLYAEESAEPQNVLLIIDEINRGNSAAIFGTVFQLLDRESNGWSSYPVDITDLEIQKLLEIIGITTKGSVYHLEESLIENINKDLAKEIGIKKGKREILKSDLEPLFNQIGIVGNKIKIPPNLHIVATMNTSDNSIYFMDSAFKRRWDWEFIDIKRKDINRFNSVDSQVSNALNSREKWEKFVDNINAFIKNHSEKIRRIEDKQIGYYFIKCDFDKGEKLNPESLRNKLMFFIWDSVFINDKKPLLDLLNVGRHDDKKIDKKKLVTFGDFIDLFEVFFWQIQNRNIT
jgi:5-methylcytosine-specific restriction protein B